MYLVVDNEREHQLAWLKAVLDKTRWSKNRLAVEARFDPSTISRFMSDNTGTRKLNSRTIEAIAKATGIPPYDDRTPPGVASIRGLAENDGAPYDAESESPTDRAIQAIRQARNGVDPWVLHTRALENAGFLPGDILLIDLNARPHRGDVVVAQIYDRSGFASTVIRFYGEPFLFSATTDMELMEPILIDKSVQVRGTMLTSLRDRRAA